MTKRCRRPSCRKKFTYEPQMLDGKEIPRLFCPGCTSWLLSRQSSSVARSALQDAGLLDSNRHLWDYRIIDERGDEVWAMDLAARYKKETRPTR